MEATTIIGTILAVVSLLGLFFNWTVVIANRKSSCVKHSFAILTANQALGDAVHSTLFLFYVCPMILLNEETMLKYSHYAGYWLLVCYDLSTQSHFLIAANRFCAVYFPMRYSSIFSESNTRKMTYIVNMTSLTITFIDFFIGCPLFWSEDLWLFIFPQSTFCQVVVFYADFCKFISIVTVIVVIDVLTVFRVQQMNRKIQSTTTLDAKAIAKRSREMSFLKQACFQGAVFTTELITYFILSPTIANPWIRFFCSSFAWVTVHAIDGFVTISFNQDFKNFALRTFCCKNIEDNTGSTVATKQSSKTSEA